MYRHCDIIIPVWNAVEHTRDCLNSILAKTDYPYRLIIVDNASDVKTGAFLDRLAEDSKITLIRNEKNVGFIKAVNQGLRNSDAPYVCVINNDTVVTQGWLSEAMRIMENNPDIGLLNPASNNLGICAPKGQNLDDFAQSLSSQNGKFIEMGAAIGFCMFIRRDIVNKIGYFDEIYGMGNFEDTDYSRRAVLIGYKCAMAKGSYVYHKGSASFKQLKDFDRDFKRNKEIFHKKWGSPKRVLYIVSGILGGLLLKNAYELARGGNWVYIFSKADLASQIEHGNVKAVWINSFFSASSLFKVLTKKKKFNEIFVDDKSHARLLGVFKFIHRADVNII